jgi:LemA protein
MRNPLLRIGLVLLTITLAGCGYNDLQRTDETIKSSWSEVLNQYQRRADLIPNLVETVKGFAKQERDVLVQVTEARSRVAQMQIPKDILSNPQAFATFQKNQDALSGALSRLMVVVERYPTLKSNENFIALQAELAGTENRVAVARNRYIKAVQEYNVTVRQFPSNLTAMLFKFEVKPNFTVENEKEISQAPKVEFGAPAK